MEEKDKSSYNNAFKATAIYGGVQFVVLFFQLLKSKSVAILIGASGMGIYGLVTQTITLVSTYISLGLESSAVKNISLADANGDRDYLNSTISVFQRVILITGILGFLFCFSFSYYLSEFVFNNHDYTLTFIITSFSLIFIQLSLGKNTVLQGLRKTTLIAKVGLLSAVSGLIVSVPLYYYFGKKGIPYSITISAILNYFISYYFSKEVILSRVPFNFEIFRTEGKNMIKMGFLISLSSLISIGSSFVLRIYITRTGSLSDVGLYIAGFAIIEGIVGILFNAMAKDYYPRLSTVAESMQERNQVVNQQIEISLLILLPILSFLLISITYFIVILYSIEFLQSAEMIQYIILGMFFRAISWSMGYLLLAKGDSKIFFWSEFISTLYVFSINIIGYKFFGLKGIGYAFILIYFIHTIQIFFTVKVFYSFSTTKNILRIIAIGTILLVAQFLIAIMVDNSFKYLIGLVLFFLSCYFSFIQIKDKTNILVYVKSKLDLFSYNRK
jgi:O-antigen/teichoic acid export membrane protein